MQIRPVQKVNCLVNFESRQGLGVIGQKFGRGLDMGELISKVGWTGCYPKQHNNINELYVLITVVGSIAATDVGPFGPRKIKKKKKPEALVALEKAQAEINGQFGKSFAQIQEE